MNYFISVFFSLFVFCFIAPQLVYLKAQSIYPWQLMRNYQQWKITFPDPDTTEIKDLKNDPKLPNFSQYFFVNQSGNGIVFKTPITLDAGTTANSPHPRSELRERTPDGTADASWNTTGIHALYVKQSITHLPTLEKELVASQIHGNKAAGIDDVMVMRLTNQDATHGGQAGSKQTEYPDGDSHNRLILGFNRSSGKNQHREDVSIKNNYILGTPHEIILEVNNGIHKAYYSEDGNLYNAYFNNHNATAYIVVDTYTPKDASDWNTNNTCNKPYETGKTYSEICYGDKTVLLNKTYDQSYFKAGNYTQSNADKEQCNNTPNNCYPSSSGGNNTENYGEVVLYDAVVMHDNSTITPPSCSRRSEGDATCDGSIDFLDYTCWVAKFTTNRSLSNCIYTDFDNMNATDLIDYVIWLQHFK